MLISFLPLIEIMHYPVVGFLTLTIVLTTLVARVRVPGRIPGALAAMIVAGAIYYLMVGFNVIHHDWRQFEQARQGLLPYEWLSVFRFEWVAIESLSESLQLALHTVRVLASSFIVTSLLWASGLAALIDRRLNLAAVHFGIAAACSFFGIIHWPLPDSPCFCRGILTHPPLKLRYNTEADTF